MSALRVLFLDEHLVAINKPSGLLVHRSAIDRRETEFALQQVRDHVGERVYPVHRLDKPTSGVLLFARSAEIARVLQSQFVEHTVVKRYIALVRGYAPVEIEVDHPLKEELDKMTDRLARQDKPAQEAKTRFRRLASVELPVAVDRYPTARYSLVEARPLTGRKHQIRRHLKHLSHPIIGDAKHGKSVHNRFFQSEYQCHRLMLACIEMRLRHPVDGEALVLRAEPGEEFERICRAFGWLDTLQDLA